MVTNCNAFYLVKSGDSCSNIASANGITLAEFYSWNPAVGSSCLSLDAAEYVCVGILGLVISTTSTSSRSSNGISTPQPIQTGMVSNCDAFYLVQAGDSCAAIASQFSITLTQFYAWNPAVGSSCATLDAADYVCVGIVGLTITTTSTKSTPTNGITTPQPIQTGMVSNCDSFYIVQSGDSCAVIVSKFGITLTQFYAWNPAVGTTCASLDLGDYVCVNIIGGTTLLTTTTSSKPGNGITTPQPIQTGMVSNCDSFYLVQSGDQCSAIASKFGISLTNFYNWNPAVGSTCATLDLGDYVCVNIVGGTTATPTSTTSTRGNGVATPTPIQTGMATNCKTFHLGKTSPLRVLAQLHIFLARRKMLTCYSRVGRWVCCHRQRRRHHAGQLLRLEPGRWVKLRYAVLRVLRMHWTDLNMSQWIFWRGPKGRSSGDRGQTRIQGF